MTLRIVHGRLDRDAAREIGRLCASLGVDHFLNERTDWLMHAFGPGARRSTDLLVVLSPESERSLWLPFQLGRAAHEGERILLYRSEPVSAQPAFLRGKPTCCGLHELKLRLEAWCTMSTRPVAATPR